MKRVLTIIGLAALIFTSCEIESPHAEFVVNYQTVIPGEVVSFRNYSDDASYYEWDFGDGTYSNEVNPSHYFSSEGVYRVRLTASHGSRVDYTYMDIDVYFTTLEVVVRDYETNELIPRVNVVVYPTLYDYDNFGEEAARGVTNYDGIVEIKDLEAQDFYLDIYNGYYNNFKLASDDLNFIHTLPLEYAAHNVFEAYVDYAPTSSSAMEKKMRVVEVKKSTKPRTLKDKKLATQQ